MKFPIVCVLCLYTVSAFGWSAKEFHPRDWNGPQGRLTNGKNASVGQFPYQVALIQEAHNQDVYICNGALIATNYVITAAHCIADIPFVKVLLGGFEIYSSEVKYNISKEDFIIHKNYKRKTLRNDIALIRIRSVRFSPNIKAVPLPKIVSEPSSYDGEVAIFTGWGDINDKGHSSTHLLWTSMSIIANKVCAEIYREGAITAGDICAAIKNKASPCDGDSGGPLVLQSSGELVGLLSAGAPTCLTGEPIAFVRITHHLKWIKTHSGVSY